MAYSDQNSLNKSKSHVNSTSIFSQARRKMSFRGKKQRRKFSPVKIFRRDGLKGKKLQYLSMKKIKDCYWLAVNDILKGHGASDTFERRFVVDTSFAIPMMTLTFATFPNQRRI
ncbi:hypothetical protein RDI58_009495 [Solanum bulbocastanum]|uniref:Uncharacterized protein n=1 Tax=Solanum bulbocastanum TaxID=147425 RepID=A0AAN8TXW9_SOLBU